MEENKTNFFSLLKPLLDGGADLTLTIRAQDDKLVVGVRPQREDIKKQLDGIRPMVLTHSAADLDESFFTTIAQPLKLIDTTAEEIKTFEASVAKAKEEATKKKPVTTSSSSSSSKSKKKKPAPGKTAGPVKPVTPAVAKPTAEEVKAQKEEKAKADKLADIKAYIGSALDNLTDLPARALDEVKKGLKLADGLEYAKEQHTQLVELKGKAEKAINEKEAIPFVEKAELTAKSMNFGECGIALKKALALAPDNGRALAVKQDLIGKLGEGFVTKLLGE